MGAQVSRKPPPPLPGGYVLGEQVYYTGASATFEDGNRVEHGEQGEVVGPATSEGGPEGKGVGVLFRGNKLAIGCYLIEVRHRRLLAPRAIAARSFAPPRLPLLLPLAIRTCGVCGRTGKPQSTTAAAGRLHRRRAGLPHGGKSHLRGPPRLARARRAGRGDGARDLREPQGQGRGRELPRLQQGFDHLLPQPRPPPPPPHSHPRSSRRTMQLHFLPVHHTLHTGGVVWAYR